MEAQNDVVPVVVMIVREVAIGVGAQVVTETTTNEPLTAMERTLEKVVPADDRVATVPTIRMMDPQHQEGVSDIVARVTENAVPMYHLVRTVLKIHPKRNEREDEKLRRRQLKGGENEVVPTWLSVTYS